MRRTSACPPWKILDQVHLPQRPRGIERLPRQLAHQLLQLERAGPARQLDMNQMLIEINRIVILPPGAGRLLYHARAKFAPAQQVGLQELTQTRDIDPPSNTSTPTIIIRLPGESMRTKRCPPVTCGRDVPCGLLWLPVNLCFAKRQTAAT